MLCARACDLHMCVRKTSPMLKKYMQSLGALDGGRWGEHRKLPPAPTS